MQEKSKEILTEQQVIDRVKKSMMERIVFVSKCKNNERLRSLEFERCRLDIVHWFSTRSRTERHRLFGMEFPNSIPFLPFNYQIEAIKEIWETIKENCKPTKDKKEGTFKEIFIEKSRQLWFSWLVCNISVYAMIFHWMKTTMISMKEKDVDDVWQISSLLEKCRFVMRNLPQWMLQWATWKSGNINNSHMKILHPNNWGAIIWQTGNKDAGRWWTRHIAYMDETASIPYAKEIIEALWPASACMIYTSTPKGEWNEFYRIRKKTIDRRDWSVFVPKSVLWLRYHRSEHPLYTKQWYENETRGRDNRYIQQEYEINYNVALEWRVYPNFSSDIYDYEYDRKLPTYISIDNSHGGRDPHAIVIFQVDGFLIKVIDCMEFSGREVGIEAMASIMWWACKVPLSELELARYNRYLAMDRKRITFIGDPYDTKSNIRDVNNPQWIVIADEYRKKGIILNTPSVNTLLSRIMLTTKHIDKVQCNQYCSSFISSISNAIYPPEGKTTAPKNKPLHDWTSHYRTALEYFISRYFNNQVMIWKKEEKPKKKLEYRDIYGNIVKN